MKKKTIKLLVKPKISRKSDKSRRMSMKKRMRSKMGCPSRMQGKKCPCVTFKTSVRDSRMKGPNPFRWKDLKSNNIFKDRKVVVFSLPGAYTPTCSTSHLPDYEKMHPKLKKLGVDDVYCVSVNDAFVMHNWGKKLGIKRVKMLPDGNAEFTKKMGALVKKKNLGFGDRSWRYSMLVDNGKIKKVFSEKGFGNNQGKDPFKVSDVKTMIKYLKGMESKN